MNDFFTNEAFSIELANTHYENFPVASFLLPKNARTDIKHIYTFARMSDDIADDKMKSAQDKIALLNTLEEDLLNNNLNNPLIKLITPIINKWNLDQTLFLDLLQAFKQDSIDYTYHSFEDLLTYSTKSANPVGRIMLLFFKQNNEQTTYYSDKICTGLQLINFWQDLSRDKMMNRYYVPQKLIKSHQLTYQEFYFSNHEKAQREIIEFLLDETEKIYLEGKKLLPLLHGRFKWEITLIWHSANRILKKLKSAKEKLIFQRPKNKF